MVTFGVPGAYLHAEMSNYKSILINPRGYFVDIMCHVKPEYEQHVRYENGSNILYILALRAIYGCIKSELLRCNIFSTTLEGLGFKINPYYRCVEKKVIYDTQCTIAWYVDEIKLSHKNP